MAHPDEWRRDANTAPTTIIVMPIYEDRDSAERLLHDLAQLPSLTDAYVVAVDDGSMEQPVAPEIISASGLRGEVLQLRRNVGHQRAIAIGLTHVASAFPGIERVAAMDSDGEDRPPSLPFLLEALAAPDVDIAIAERKNRFESLRFKGLYWIYKRIFEMLVGRRIAFGNFIALKGTALHRIVAMPELWLHLPGTVLSSRLRLAKCPTDRGRRYAGQSKMSFVALALHGFKGIMVFSEVVLVRMGVLCTIVAVCSLGGAIAAVAMKFMGHTTPGWSTVVLGVLLLTFLQMGALTLMMLMLTGLMRAGTATVAPYTDYVARRLTTLPAWAPDSRSTP